MSLTWTDGPVNTDGVTNIEYGDYVTYKSYVDTLMNTFQYIGYDGINNRYLTSKGLAAGSLYASYIEGTTLVATTANLTTINVQTINLYKTTNTGLPLLVAKGDENGWEISDATIDNTLTMGSINSLSTTTQTADNTYPKYNILGSSRILGTLNVDRITIGDELTGASFRSYTQTQESGLNKTTITETSATVCNQTYFLNEVVKQVANQTWDAWTYGVSLFSYPVQAGTRFFVDWTNYIGYKMIRQQRKVYTKVTNAGTTTSNYDTYYCGLDFNKSALKVMRHLPLWSSGWFIATNANAYEKTISTDFFDITEGLNYGESQFASYDKNLIMNPDGLVANIDGNTYYPYPKVRVFVTPNATSIPTASKWKTGQQIQELCLGTYSGSSTVTGGQYNVGVSCVWSDYNKFTVYTGVQYIWIGYCPGGNSTFSHFNVTSCYMLIQVYP